MRYPSHGRASGGRGRRLFAALALAALVTGGLMMARGSGGGKGRRQIAPPGRAGAGEAYFYEGERAPVGGGGPDHGRAMPFAVSGGVASIDHESGRLLLRSMTGRDDGRTLLLTPDTRIVARKETRLSDLRPGDSVRVRGVPTGITADSVTAGGGPDFLDPGWRPGSAVGGGGRRAGGDATDGVGGNVAAATGRVTAVRSPALVTLTLGDGASLTVRLAPDARVTRFTRVGIPDVRAGDRVTAAGRIGPSGEFVATDVALNLERGGNFGGIGGGGYPGPARPTSRAASAPPPPASAR